jgi:tetratricopeptide (TPR) repeat protein
LLVLVAREDLDDGLETEPGFLDLLRKDDRGDCAYLDVDGTCTVWERRPLDCRVYSCEDRERPSLLRTCTHDPAASSRARPVAVLPCAHCGATAGYVVRFVWTARRIRCAACGGPFLPRVVSGSPLRLRVDPSRRTDAERLSARAATREYLGDLRGALDAFAAAAAAEPDAIDHHLDRLRVAIRLGEDDAAAEAFEAAHARDPARAWLGRGLALDVAGRLEESRADLLRAEALGSRSAGLSWALARAARASGRIEEAVSRLATAASLGENDVRITQDLIDLALEGAPGAGKAIESTGDGRALAAIGLLPTSWPSSA